MDEKERIAFLYKYGNVFSEHTRSGQKASMEMDMLDNGQIVVSESDFVLGKLVHDLECLQPATRVALVREMLRLTVRRKDDFYCTMNDILSQDWSPITTPSPEIAVRSFVYTDYFPENQWRFVGTPNFCVLAHHQYFPLPTDTCSAVPENVESEHLLLVRPQPNMQAELARWAMTWEPNLEDPTNLASTTEIWSLPLHWNVIKHEFTILDDTALGEQLKKPHLSALAWNGFAQDPLYEIIHKVKMFDQLRSDRREASYRKDVERSAEFTALLARIGR